jgi:hypothetical protein
MLTTPMSLLQKGDSQLFNSKSLLFQSKYCKLSQQLYNIRKLFSSKFARYKLLKLNIMKIIMVGMVAFVVCKYPSPEKIQS